MPASPCTRICDHIHADEYRKSCTLCGADVQTIFTGIWKEVRVKRYEFECRPECPQSQPENPPYGSPVQPCPHCARESLEAPGRT